MSNISVRNTKNDILKAYKTLLEENKKLKINQQKNEKELIKTQDAYNKAATLLKSSNSEPIVKTVTVEKVIEKVPTIDNVNGIIEVIDGIQTGIGAAINQCSQMQVIEAEKLAELQEKIKTHTQEVQALYSIEIKLGNGTLDSIISDYENEQENFDKDFKQQQETSNEEYAERLYAWKKEKEAKLLEIKERIALDILTKEREIAEYKYALLLERDNQNDAYAQKCKKLSDDLLLIEETKQEELAEKEKSVKTREDELKDYKAKYEELPNRLSKAVKSAEYEGTAIIERDAKVKMDMLKKEVESNQMADSLKIKALETEIDSQNQQLQKLSTQLENALKQAQNLAIKAIEGSANSDSFDAIKAIAMEQAKHTTKSK